MSLITAPQSTVRLADYPEEARAELERIVQSRWLRDSHQLAGLLRHCVEETLAGRADNLKEYNLGIEVFHRRPDFDTRNDAIVRVQASALRKKLTGYYESEGAGSTWRLELPRGGYIPVLTPPTVPPSEEPLVSPRRSSWRTFAWGALAGAVCAVLTVLLMRPAPAPQIHAPALWSAFLADRVPTIVSFGVPLFYGGDGGFYIRDVQVNNTGSPLSQRLLDFGKAIGVTFRPHEDVYTGIGEAIGSLEVARFLDRHGQPVQVVNSHNLGLSEIRDRNLIVISSLRFQTLLNVLRMPSPFAYHGDEEGHISLSDPSASEKSLYITKGNEGVVSTTYALVTLWPSTRPGRRILRLGGSHSWTTLGAVQFVLDPKHQQTLQRLLDADPPAGPHGKKSQFYEVLLRVEGKYEQVRKVEYVTHRYFDPAPPTE